MGRGRCGARGVAVPCVRACMYDVPRKRPGRWCTRPALDIARSAHELEHDAPPPLCFQKGVSEKSKTVRNEGSQLSTCHALRARTITQYNTSPCEKRSK